MRYSIWSKLASYVIDVVLEKKQSTYSGGLELIQRKGRLALCTTNAVYSYEDLYVNFRDSFDRLDLDQLEGNNVLVLGLGLGSIPLLLERHFHKKYSYTLVEIDPVIVDLAQQYTLPYLKSEMKVITGDAADFVSNCSDQFDMIAIDIFIDDETPSVFETTFFLKEVRKLLKPSGVLLYNRLTYDEKLTQKTEQFYEKCFNYVYEKSCCIDLGGNKMLLNYDMLK
jgi:SAM-dependent methyltransferase